jgi:uncharacterized iron-regulated membrane protein
MPITWSQLVQQLNRKIHRWLGVIAIIFFLSVSITGVVLQYQAIFGGDEVAHEAMAALQSPVTTAQPFAVDAAAFGRARVALAARYPNVPVASVDWLIKGATPAFTFHLDGAEPLRVKAAASTGAIISAEPDGEDWIKRLHTGEIIGDGSVRANAPPVNERRLAVRDVPSSQTAQPVPLLQFVARGDPPGRAHVRPVSTVIAQRRGPSL